MKRPEKETPASDQEAGAGITGEQPNGSTAGDASGETQKEETARIGKVSSLTDLKAVNDFRKRLAEETGATVRASSMWKLVIEEKRTGAYTRCVQVGWVKFDAEGHASASAPDYQPKGDEQEAICKEWAGRTWPKYQPVLFTARDLPRNDPRFPWSFAEPQNLAVCKSTDAQMILCVEERRYHDDGSKDAFIWSYWSHGDEGKWHCMEPPDFLPLFGLDTIAGAATIFVHEGPKAAKAVQALIADEAECADHPWGTELRGSRHGAVAHVGWMGGAERPEATDWRPLINSGARIIIVADNDRPGIDAVSRISRVTGMKLDALCFNDDWPLGFDLGDPFPAERAKTRVSDLLVPATWTTEVIHTGRRPSYQLRPRFISEWRYTVSPPLFFHAAYPGRGFTDAEVDAMVRPFSDAELTARLIRQHFSAQADGVAYLPGSKPLIERNGQRLVNMWRPSRVKERDGSAWPLGRLLTHAFPDKADRLVATRWGATHAACPSVRMEFAMLLRTEEQGVGKTTLANTLADLTGPENVSRPNEAALTEGNFNSHLAKKRLVIVDELYSGHSRKTYNRLKAPITDTKLRVNEKYQPEYEIDNFAHFIFSSNDLVPIFIDASDRRFFMPRMAETKLPRSFWVRFHSWLAGDGLGIILRCAREFVEKHGSIQPGQPAPMSAAKAAMIDNSISDEMRSVREAARDMFERGQRDERIAVTLESFQIWHGDLCRARGWKRLTGNRLRDELRKAGLTIRGRDGQDGPDQRVVINGRKKHVAFNFDVGDGEEAADAIRSALKTMDDLGFGEPL